MEPSRNIDIKRNFTILDESIWGYVLDREIKLVDVVVFAAIKSQNDGNYGRSMADIGRLYNIPRATTERCIGRLNDVKLVTVTYKNGKATVKNKNLDTSVFEKVPKSLLMSDTLTLPQKSFMLAAWNEVFDGHLEHSKASLQRDVFSQYHKGLSWVAARVDELVGIGLIEIDKRSMRINFEMIVDMSDTVISSVLMESSHLENVVVAYEEKTGVTRDNIFDWEEVKGDVPKKEFNSPKWIKPITNAINVGCVTLGKKEYSFTGGEVTIIKKHVNDIIDNTDGDSKERIVEKIVNSIIWKANNASRNESEKKFWTLGFFTRKTKNNFASNLYHYNLHVEANPYGKKPSEVKVTKKVAKKVTKDTGGFEEFDYGIDF